MGFFYVWFESHMFNHLMKKFRIWIPGNNAVKSKHFTPEYISKNNKLPDVIIIDIPINEEALFNFNQLLKRNLLLNTLPLLYHDKHLTVKQISKLNQLQLVDDVLTIDAINVNYNSKVLLLKPSKLHDNLYAATRHTLVKKEKVNPVPTWKLKYPGMIFIRSEKNIGFTGGNNLGMTYAKGDYFFVINNDTEVTSELISQLVKTLELHPKIGVIFPKTNYFDSRMYFNKQDTQI